jgi:hypothetical protein
MTGHLLSEHTINFNGVVQDKFRGVSGFRTDFTNLSGWHPLLVSAYIVLPAIDWNSLLTIRGSMTSIKLKRLRDCPLIQRKE